MKNIIYRVVVYGVQVGRDNTSMLPAAFVSSYLKPYALNFYVKDLSYDREERFHKNDHIVRRLFFVLEKTEN